MQCKVATIVISNGAGFLVGALAAPTGSRPPESPANSLRGRAGCIPQEAGRGEGAATAGQGERQNRFQKNTRRESGEITLDVDIQCMH